MRDFKLENCDYSANNCPVCGIDLNTTYLCKCDEQCPGEYLDEELVKRVIEERKKFPSDYILTAHDLEE